MTAGARSFGTGGVPVLPRANGRWSQDVEVLLEILQSMIFCLPVYIVLLVKNLKMAMNIN